MVKIVGLHVVSENTLSPFIVKQIATSEPCQGLSESDSNYILNWIL